MTREELFAHSHVHPLVFFDGVCGLCSKSVDWIISHDYAGKVHFTPLQGTAAKLALSESERADLDTVVVLKNAIFYRRSSAFVEIMRTLGGPWALVGILTWLVPKPFRDFVYNQVAGRRYRIWGKSETCRLPTKDERSRFLD